MWIPLPTNNAKHTPYSGGQMSNILLAFGWQKELPETNKMLDLDRADLLQ